MELNQFIEDIIRGNSLVNMVVSNYRRKQNECKRINIKPVTIKDEYLLQFESIVSNKAFHENLEADEAIEKLTKTLTEDFKNIFIRTEFHEYQCMVSKKGKLTCKKRDAGKVCLDLSHNRKKEYIIPDNEKCDFLMELGVMDENGKVYKKKYDKFRQINKFLEIVDGTIDGEKFEEKLRIVDFGCGKAYLTFGLYYYFNNILKKDVEIIGLDLKDDVIDFCNKTSKNIGYEKLEFIKGDISDFNAQSNIDMIVTLHACNNATDAALVKAVKWDVDYILSVPCCQHEFFSKIENDSLLPMIEHGLIKERLSSLVTDTLRTLYLNNEGYEVKLVEFVAMEHTPKNIMIKGIKKGQDVITAKMKYNEFKKFWNLDDLFIEKYHNEEIGNDY
ncbi:Methyltransferase domain-containing protein [Dethiosulfatibacter aminovorans DSM 17477]|uniref:Methyltransferase domain-containing protein n=1 Tax=Dethiosulfatibacter aminovorans DSM 17477 TaxID=1121476 RepID=A0A1M6J5B5_9FIRM|nr:SAM-dependent methyltransferase [Dethiosulfatibacter aminovorans]SHJ41831.1 Methyltransferase domain-containing protein [Dethiosulfatibacter aminovorans DSM 17477]